MHDHEHIHPNIHLKIVKVTTAVFAGGQTLGHHNHHSCFAILCAPNVTMLCNPSSKCSPGVQAQSARNCDDKEAKLQQALADLEAGMYANPSQAAAAHQVPQQMLVDRLHGKTPKKGCTVVAAGAFLHC